MKIRIIYNKDNSDKTLMVHSFSSSILNGDDVSINIDIIFKNNDLKKEFIQYLKKNNINTITFDDGLYQQIPLIKMFNKHFKTIFFPSGEFIRKNNIEPIIIENSIAHDQYHKTKTYPNTFMSSIEIWDLLHENNNFGIHGWYHYNLDPNYLPEQLGSSNFRQILNILKQDSKKCAKFYMEMILEHPSLFIKDCILNINYCTPYNCLNEYQKLYIDFFKTYLNQYIVQNGQNKKIIELIITVYSHERIPIEKLIEQFKKEKKCHYVTD